MASDLNILCDKVLTRAKSSPVLGGQIEPRARFQFVNEQHAPEHRKIHYLDESRAP